MFLQYISNTLYELKQFMSVFMCESFVVCFRKASDQNYVDDACGVNENNFGISHSKSIVFSPKSIIKLYQISLLEIC